MAALLVALLTSFNRRVTDVHRVLKIHMEQELRDCGHKRRRGAGLDIQSHSISVLTIRHEFIVQSGGRMKCDEEIMDYIANHIEDIKRFVILTRKNDAEASSLSWVLDSDMEDAIFDVAEKEAAFAKAMVFSDEVDDLGKNARVADIKRSTVEFLRTHKDLCVAYAAFDRR